MMSEMRGLIVGTGENKESADDEAAVASKAADEKAAKELANRAEAKARADAKAEVQSEAKAAERWKATMRAEEDRKAAAAQAAKSEKLNSLRAAAQKTRKALKAAEKAKDIQEIENLKRFKTFLARKEAELVAVELDESSGFSGVESGGGAGSCAGGDKSTRRGRQAQGTKSKRLSDVYEDSVWASEFARGMAKMGSGAASVASWPSPTKPPKGQSVSTEISKAVKLRFPNFQPWMWHMLLERSVAVDFVQPEQSLGLLTGQKQIEGVLFTLGSAAPSLQSHSWKPWLLASAQAFQHEWDQVVELLDLAHGPGEETRAGRAYRTTMNSLLVSKTWDCKAKTESLAWYHAACMVVWKVTNRLPVRELTFMGTVIKMPAMAKLQIAPSPYNDLAELGDRPAYVHSKVCGGCKLVGYPQAFCPSCKPSLPGAQAAAVVRAARMRR